MCLLLSVVWCQWHAVLLSTDGGTLGWNSPQLVTRGTSPELTLLPPVRGRLRAVACDWCVQSSAPADCLARYHIYIVLSWACDPSAGREIWFAIFHYNHNIWLNIEQDSCENLNISSMNSSLVLASLVVAAVLASEFEAGEGGQQGQPRHRQFRFSDPVRLGWTTGNMAILLDNIGNIGR